VALIIPCVSALSFRDSLWLSKDTFARRHFGRLFRVLRWQQMSAKQRGFPATQKSMAALVRVWSQSQSVTKH